MVEPTRSQNITVSCLRSALARPRLAPGIARSRHHRSGGHFGAELGNGSKEFAALADRGHADADQAVGRQRRQHFVIDIVVAECRRVSFGALARAATPLGPCGNPWLGGAATPFMTEDFGVASGSAEYAPCRASRLQAVNDCF